jgi:hypothetical protein
LKLPRLLPPFIIPALKGVRKLFSDKFYREPVYVEAAMIICLPVVGPAGRELALIFNRAAFIIQSYWQRRLLIASTADYHIVDDFKINLFGSHLLCLPVSPPVIHSSHAFCLGNGYHFLCKIFAVRVL